jgi:DNA-binding NarL/FixJ family response regulator
MIRVIVVDDHPLFRDGLTGLLRTVGDVEVVASAGDGEEAVRRTVELVPDVVLMDLNMPACLVWRRPGGSSPRHLWSRSWC